MSELLKSNAYFVLTHSFKTLIHSFTLYLGLKMKRHSTVGAGDKAVLLSEGQRQREDQDSMILFKTTPNAPRMSFQAAHLKCTIILNTVTVRTKLLPHGHLGETQRLKLKEQKEHH